MISIFLKGVLPVLVLLAAGVGSYFLMDTKPTAERKEVERRAQFVEVAPIEVALRTAVVEARGAVQASRSVTLRPQVSGRVIAISPNLEPGGLVERGAPLVTLDPADLQLVVAQRQAALRQAQADLDIEKGQQNVAQKELELLGRSVSDSEKSLVLRAPQLAAVQSSLEAAKANLDQALLDLKRTEVYAPFDAVIEERDVDIGAQVTTSTSMATLVGTETYWVELLVAADQLKWIEIPRQRGEVGSPVRIYNEVAWGPNTYREATVVRLKGSLEEAGRMARVLVEVQDPLSLEPENADLPVLLIGSFVRAEIQGKPIGPAIVLPRDVLHDEDTIWLVKDGNQLEIETLDILFRARDWVMVRNPLPADRWVITSQIPAAVPGMALRTDPVIPIQPTSDPNNLAEGNDP